MQSGIDSSRLRIAAETVMPTRDTARVATPAPADAQETADATPTPVPSGSSFQIGVANPTKTNTTCASGGTCSNASNKGLFGPSGPSFRDALDAVNPLNQIPIVSDILANVTGHEPSTASKLAGGALATLISGPIGFAASLASVIFESGAGQSPANAVYAALTGNSESGATQVASVDTAVEPVEATQLASLEPAASSTANAMAAVDAQAQADAAVGAPEPTGNPVLDLYGGSTQSAHASYRKAQLLPYLRDVNSSKVL